MGVTFVTLAMSTDIEQLWQNGQANIATAL
jgi:hypothetical protein